MHEIETESESSSLLCLEDKSPFPSRKDPGLCDEIKNGSRPQGQLIGTIEADDVGTTSNQEKKDAAMDAPLLVMEDTVHKSSLDDITLQSQTSEMDTEFVNDNMESTEFSDAEDELDTLWVTCAWKLQHMMNSLDRTGH